jgi:outer membrane protein assembly factor BamB
MRLVAVTSVMIAAIAAIAADWPQWLGPKRDASSVEIVPPWAAPLKPAWSVPVGEGHSSPVVAGGKVYLHTKVANEDKEQLTIYDAATGKELGSSTQPRKPFTSGFGVGPRATPLVTPEGEVITLGVTGNLNVQGAARNWITDVLETNQAPNLRFGVSASPLVVGDRLIVMVGGRGAGLVAYNRADGKVLWKSLNDSASYAAPILIDHAGQKLVAALTAEGLVAVRPETGQEVWRFPFKDALAESSSTPVQVGDTIVISSITLGSAAVKLTTNAGQLAVESLWKNPELTCYFSTPVAVGEHVYFTTGRMILPSVTLHCVAARTGAVAWSRKNVGKYNASLLRTGDNKLLMHSDSGELTLIDPDPKEYRELCKSKICGETWAHPALANGRLYVRDGKHLVCVPLTNSR